MIDAVQRRYERLYRSYYGPTVARVSQKVENRADAEDIVARAYVRLYRQLEAGAQVDNMLARLNTIIKGLTLNHWRDDERRPEEPAGLLPDLAWLSDSAQLPRHDLADFPDDFDQAVRDLDEPQREAFILTELRGLTVREAGDVLGIGKSAAQARAEAARTHIREELIL